MVIQQKHIVIDHTKIDNSWPPATSRNNLVTFWCDHFDGPHCTLRTLLKQKLSASNWLWITFLDVLCDFISRNRALKESQLSFCHYFRGLKLETSLFMTWLGRDRTVFMMWFGQEGRNLPWFIWMSWKLFWPGCFTSKFSFVPTGLHCKFCLVPEEKKTILV